MNEFSDAIKALQEHERKQSFWIAKAITLLQLTLSPPSEIDRAKLVKEIQSHIERAP